MHDPMCLSLMNVHNTPGTRRGEAKPERNSVFILTKNWTEETGFMNYSFNKGFPQSVYRWLILNKSLN